MVAAERKSLTPRFMDKSFEVNKINFEFLCVEASNSDVFRIITSYHNKFKNRVVS